MQLIKLLPIIKLRQLLGLLTIQMQLRHAFTTCAVYEARLDAIEGTNSDVDWL